MPSLFDHEGHASQTMIRAKAFFVCSPETLKHSKLIEFQIMERFFIMEPSRTKRSIYKVEIAFVSSGRWLTQSMKFW